MSPLLQTAHFFTAAYMTGIIWFVQLVQYPMFHHTEGSDSSAHEEYTRRMGFVVMPVMLTELALQTLWVARAPDPTSLICASLLAAIWLSTFFLQVPCHQKLTQEHNPAVRRRLVRTNWIRTIAWSGRALLLASTIV